MRAIITEVDKPKFPQVPFLAKLKGKSSILYINEVSKNKASGLYIGHPPEQIIHASQKGIQVINISELELFEGKIILSNNLI
jgi:hypothetical protein